MSAPESRRAIPDPLAPATLGPVKLRNRVIKAATSEGRSPDGLVTDELIEFHLAYAKGGVGMTTVAYCAVLPEGRAAPGEIVMTPSVVPGMRRLTDAVHEAGAAVSLQLGHAGMVASKADTGVRSVAPSARFNPSSFEWCRSVTRDEIAHIVERFGQAAALAVDCGADAVEIHLGHLYLPSSFMSPWLNKRTDEYGGSLENRTRFAREIAHRVREEVGHHIAVLAKISMDDGIAGSIWLDESLGSARLLDADGTLDGIELTMGSSVLNQMYLFRGETPIDEFAAVLKEPFKTGVRWFGKWVLGEYPYRDLYMLEHARQFVPAMKHTKLVLLGGINDLGHMRTAMEEGFDFVAMGRALLREPDLVRRIQADPRATGRCVHCNKCMPTVFGKTHCVLA